MGNARNTVAYFKEEGTPGTPLTPTSASDGYVSIEKPDVTTGEKENLESELLSGNIGVKKPQLGLETASATVVTELRSHGDTSSPTEPDFGIWLKSAIGTAITSTAEAVESTPAPSTTEFGISTEGNIKRYDFMIIDNATDGRVARFAKERKFDVIAATNDKIDIDEDGGGELTATLAPGTYVHGSDSVSGSIGEELKAKLEVAGAGTYTIDAELQSDGSYKYTISVSGLTTLVFKITTGTNTATNWMKLNGGFGSADLSGALTYTAASSVHGNRVVCNVAMDSAPTAADVVSATVNYKPINEAHKHFTAGFYQGNSASDGYFEQIAGCLIGSLAFNVETGAYSKINADLQGLSAARTATTASTYTPDYEDVQGLVGFNVEAFKGSTSFCANAFNLTIEDEISEQLSFCEASGKSGSIVRKRTITGDINPYADGSITNYNDLIALTDRDFMIVIGVKDSGGYVVGKTVGIYLPQMMLTQDKTGDIDDSLTEDINFQAHTGEGGNLTDIVVSFG